MPVASKDVLIRLVSESRQQSSCKGCGRKILWFETLEGKRMPMNAHAMVRQLGIGFDMYSSDDSHWATCPKRERFDRKNRTLVR
jgi:hypothetical protein